MYAAIDVGTNSVRLLLADLCAGNLAPVSYFRKITRLGGGFTIEKGLSPEAMERTLSALLDAVAVIRSSKATAIRAVGTSALREALNGPEFLATVRFETGLDIQIISGDMEARLCARGVLAALNPSPDECLIFDIGGGSTEFIFHTGQKSLFHRSYPLGVVSLGENFKTPTLQRTRVAEVLDGIQHDLEADDLLEVVRSPKSVLVGTAGTVSTLAAIYLGMVDYDWRRVNNLVINRGTIEFILEELADMTPSARESLPGMEEGRGDLIVPGLLLILEIMQRFGKNNLLVSDFGLLEGVALTLADTSPE